MRKTLSLLADRGFHLLSKYDFRIIDTKIGPMGAGYLTMINDSLFLRWGQERGEHIVLDIGASSDYKDKDHFRAFDWGVIREYLTGVVGNSFDECFPTPSLKGEIELILELMPQIMDLFAPENKEISQQKLTEIYNYCISRIS